MSKILLSLSVIFAFMAAPAQEQPANVFIEGKCRLGDHTTVLAYTMRDFLSMEKKELALTIAEKGSYKLQFHVSSTTQIFLQIGSTVGEMYVVPNNSYQVNIPVVLQGEQVSFDKTTVELQFINLPETDINYAMRRFNADYRSFIDDHYYEFAVGEYRGSETFKSNIGDKAAASDIYRSGDQKKGFSDQQMPLGDFNNWVELFALYVDSGYVASRQDPFFRDYTDYRIAELELVSGVRPIIISEENFYNKAIPYEQPGYFNLFKLVYSNLFAKVSEQDTREWVRMAINAEKSIQSLEFAFKNDSLFFNENIRTLAMINAIRESYNNPEYVKNSMEILLDNIIKKDRRPDIVAVASSVLRSLKKGKTGWAMEDFTLINEKNEPWTFSEHHERATYFVFFANWCSSCLKELQVLEKIQSEYAGYVDIVAVNMDDSFADLKKYQKEHPTQKFTFLYGPYDPMVKEKFSLHALPTVMMVDTEGRTMYDSTRKPSEGIQQEFEGIKVRATKNVTTGPKTWKD